LMVTGGVIGSIPPLVLTFLLQKYIVADLTAGAAKGLAGRSFPSWKRTSQDRLRSLQRNSMRFKGGRTEYWQRKIPSRTGSLATNIIQQITK
jgi:hypothetical protein